MAKSVFKGIRIPKEVVDTVLRVEVLQQIKFTKEGKIVFKEQRFGVCLN